VLGDLGQLQHDRLACREGAGAHEDALGLWADRLRLGSPGPLDVAEGLGIEAVQKVVIGLDATGLEL